MWGFGIGTGLTRVAALATSAETAPVVVVADEAVVDSAEAEVVVASPFEVFSALQPTIPTTVTQSKAARMGRVLPERYGMIFTITPL
jgi:hypothetical protein